MIAADGRGQNVRHGIEPVAAIGENSCRRLPQGKQSSSFEIRNIFAMEKEKIVAHFFRPTPSPQEIGTASSTVTVGLSMRDTADSCARCAGADARRYATNCA